jgi:N-acyl-D-aspartate/D-glutamate deacylase
MHDIVIRNGLVHDGSGGEAFAADVAIDGHRIVAVGVIDQPGREEIDARGCAVTPGFVDIHTHYDGQVLWEDRIVPSAEHGVTTVVMGNCAVGIAPCKPEQRDLLIGVMAGVEDIPEAVMAEGLAWNWETFPEYLDVLEQRHCDVDFAAQLPHGCVRVYVMGQRGADREPATADDLAQMTAIVEEALQAGAIGVSSSHTISHRAVDGQLAPAETAAEAELLALARGMRNTAKGVLEFITDFPGLPHDDTADFDLMRRFAAAAGRPLSYTLVQIDSDPAGWRKQLALIEQAKADGIEIRGQVAARAIGISFGLDLSFNPFSFRPSYTEIASLPLPERVQAMRQPDRRARILAEQAQHPNQQLVWMISLVDKMFLMDERFDYERPLNDNIGHRAERLGMSAWELVYDTLLENEGRRLLYLPITNYTEGSLDAALAMMRHAQTVVALGDGGAHYGLICDASYPTFMLTHWTRDREGERLSAGEAIKMLTADPAAAVGLLDRGFIRPGYKADLNVIDLSALRLGKPEVRYDLPSQGRRILQRAEGYRATILSGQVTYRNGTHTGQLPGRLVRGAQTAPTRPPGAST